MINFNLHIQARRGRIWCYIVDYLFLYSHIVCWLFIRSQKVYLSSIKGDGLVVLQQMKRFIWQQLRMMNQLVMLSSC